MRSESLTIILVVAVLLSTAAKSVGYPEAEPAMSVDITETEIKINSTYKDPVTVTFNGTITIEKPLYQVGDITVSLTTVNDAAFSATIEPTTLTFKQSGTRSFSITVTVPQETTSNMTLVHATAVAESLTGRSVKEDSAILTLDHADACEEGQDCPNNNDGLDGKEDGKSNSTVSFSLATMMCIGSVVIAFVIMAIAYMTKRLSFLEKFLKRKKGDGRAYNGEKERGTEEGFNREEN